MTLDVYAHVISGDGAENCGFDPLSSSELSPLFLAVRVRFELTEPVKVQRFSRPPHSTTLPPHRALVGLILILPAQDGGEEEGGHYRGVGFDQELGGVYA